ncbi:unnamed protein product [Urochloa humidicola]
MTVPLPPDVTDQYVEMTKEKRREEKLKNTNLDDWLPITSSHTTKWWYYSTFHIMSPPWSMLACSASPSPCPRSDGARCKLTLIYLSRFNFFTNSYAGIWARW